RGWREGGARPLPASRRMGERGLRVARAAPRVGRLPRAQGQGGRRGGDPRDLRALGLDPLGGRPARRRGLHRGGAGPDLGARAGRLGPAGPTRDSRAGDDVVKLGRWLSREEPAARTQAARDGATTLPSANGKVATIGFCGGGGGSFAGAAGSHPPQACVVYY